jgi:topoisomerase IA-like protein
VCGIFLKQTSGKSVTEDENFELIKNYEAEKINKSVKRDNKSTKGKGPGKKSKVEQTKNTTKKSEKTKNDDINCVLKNLVHLM